MCCAWDSASSGAASRGTLTGRSGIAQFIEESQMASPMLPDAPRNYCQLHNYPTMRLSKEVSNLFRACLVGTSNCSKKVGDDRLIRTNAGPKLLQEVHVQIIFMWKFDFAKTKRWANFGLSMTRGPHMQLTFYNVKLKHNQHVSMLCRSCKGCFGLENV